MNRFDAFDTKRFQVSNEKSPDGEANLTHLTHLTANRRGCTWRASASVRAASRHTPFNWCQMRQTRQIPDAVMRFSFDARCQTGCQFDTPRLTEVVR